MNGKSKLKLRENSLKHDWISKEKIVIMVSILNLIQNRNLTKCFWNKKLESPEEIRY